MYGPIESKTKMIFNRFLTEMNWIESDRMIGPIGLNRLSELPMLEMKGLHYVTKNVEMLKFGDPRKVGLVRKLTENWQN